MPTAARLIAALSLAALGYVLSRMIMPLMPEATQFGYFIPTNILIGLIVGWVVVGARASHGIVAGINLGVTGAAVLVFWGLATQGTREMIKKSLLNRYDGLGDATIAALKFSAEYFLIMATWEIGLVALVGGALTGVITNLAYRSLP